MKNCQYCGFQLLKGAKFCHNCGKPTTTKSINCPKCRASNPSSSKFCFNCGEPIDIIYAPGDYITPIYKLDFRSLKTLSIQIRDAFLVAISMAVEADGELSRENYYLDAFESTGFRVAIFDEQAQIMSKLFQKAYQKNGYQSFMMIELQLYAAFQRLLERFWVQYLVKILPQPLSPKILNYEKTTLENVNLHQLMVDYLALDLEAESHYLNAVDIPVKKLKQAQKIFFKHQVGEVPYVFIDQTLLGSGKEGLVLTNKGLYWKAAFHKAANIQFQAISNLKRYKNHLEINGIYLNINPSINYKLLKLLQRIKRFFEVLNPI
ncbi:MAG: zinc ribbon domain-containing protein [Saprospiraceae bacterium]|nr:zinc ribbon domain-containing protein [Saprospiraceae bacterium]